jgi:hypothetical protein
VKAGGRLRLHRARLGILARKGEVFELQPSVARECASQSSVK